MILLLFSHIRGSCNAHKTMRNSRGFFYLKRTLSLTAKLINVF